jgi:hypothetical protein
MSSGFIYCGNCGAASTQGGQKFCASCGATLPEIPASQPVANVFQQPAQTPPAPPAWAAPSAPAPGSDVPPVWTPLATPAPAPDAPPAWAGQQVPPPGTPAWGAPPPPPAPPAWGTPPPAPGGPGWGAPPPQGQWNMAPPPRKSNGPLVAVIAIVGVIVILALLVGTVLAFSSGSKSSASPSASSIANATATIPVGPPASPSAQPSAAPVGKNTIVMTPATWSCSAASAAISVTITLTSAFAATDMVYPEIDGTPGTGSAVSKNFTQQANGSWKETESLTTSDFCTSFDTGDHTLGIMDVDNVILAEIAFTMDA